MFTRAIGLLKKDGKWDRKRIIIAALAWLFLSFVCLAAIPTDEDASGPSPSRSTGSSSAPRLFVDASGGIEQFIGGQTMPEGTYDFKCGFAGNVGIASGTVGTTSMRSGNQTRTVQYGDIVTLAMCKAYGPK